MPALKIIYKSPAALKPRTSNPRTHSKKQVQQIVTSIKEFGFLSPILIDGADGIIAGHGRVEAAKLIGMGDVPTVRVDHLTPAQIRAYVIADNKLAENAGWDRRLLALELQELSVELNFDVAITGFETAEIDLLVQELDQNPPDEADQVPEIDRTRPAVSRPGDLWRIGNHVLLCGDALDNNNYARVLGAKQAQMVFTDPPFNVPIAGNVTRGGKHREFVMASGEMSSTEFTQFLEKTFTNLAQFSTSGSIHFICMDWRHMREVLDAAAKPYSELKNVCVWAKTNAGMGSLYRSQHELVFVYKNGNAPHINNVELGRFGRNRSNLWTYAGQNSFGSNRDSELAMHPTVKPVALIADAILDCTKRGATVLDSFAGSGSTLIAAERTGRYGRAIEIDPYYVDVVIQRFEQVFGIKAVHADLDLDFSAVSRSRLKEKKHGQEKGVKSKRRRRQRRGQPA